MPAGSIAVRNVSKRFGSLVAVNDITFSVPPGETFGIVGPNGAGKTTLLNCISGLERMDSGLVHLDGVPIHEKPAHQRASIGIARTFQLAENFKSFTALDFVLLGRLRWQPGGIIGYALSAPSIRRSERREAALARRSLDQLELGHLAGEALGELPYGVQKRVDLARAMASEPKLLLLDEPTSGLSPAERKGIMDVLAQISAEWAVTRIVVDHDVAFVSKTCTRVLVMDYGEELAIGTPKEVLAIPAVQAAYLGS
jgi:ABC-type branched-subunit amino acid transport system ATPase component